MLLPITKVNLSKLKSKLRFIKLSLVLKLKFFQKKNLMKLDIKERNNMEHFHINLDLQSILLNLLMGLQNMLYQKN